MIETRERNDVQPICPHCEKEIREVWVREMSAVLGKRYVCFCPECRKVIGVTHRKGFWMG